MKTLINLILSIIINSWSTNAQNLSPGAGIPSWGVPVTTERYYYIPDIETYYDIPSREYIYLNDGVWTRSNSVPARYRNYNFYQGRKIVLNDYSGNAPYAFYNIHRVKYVPSYRAQKVWTKIPPGHLREHGKAHMRGRGQGHRR